MSIATTFHDFNPKINTATNNYSIMFNDYVYDQISIKYNMDQSIQSIDITHLWEITNFCMK